MAKILLVEDDNNLREIYEARLQAEGYTIVSARDGEEALVVAKAEKPDLVISDVMMHKISGFEMLDILRNTNGLKDVRVIMLTALGQADDQQRANKLGADRYLVKSQVTLEDIVKAAQDLLAEEAGAGASTAPTPAPPAPTTPVATPPPDNDDTPTKDDRLMNDAVDSLVAGASTGTATAKTPEKPAKVDVQEEPQDDDDTESSDTDSDQVSINRKKVIKPIERKGKDIQTLLAEEEAKESGASVTDKAAATPDPTSAPADAVTTASEEAAMDAKIEDFVAGATTDPTPPRAPATPATPPPKPPQQPTRPQSTTPPPSQTPPSSPPVDPNIISL
jgi:CheY-like chemotaxis protein